ncbi:hypothetical protein ACHAWF_018993 [Thalassiosira exigua]
MSQHGDQKTAEPDAPVPFTAREEEDLLDGLPVMTKAELQKIALEHGGYSTAHLNDILYLHFKGYRRIENLEGYTALKALYLHSNGFGKIENLSHLRELRCLFLQRNALTKIEGLHGLESLVQLDLSENNIKLVEGLSHLPNLTTLNLSKNALKDAGSILHLKDCTKLTSVDLTKNQLSGVDIVDCLSGLGKVASLNMTGNPVVSKVAYFRKKMIVACKTLRYLDRPVFDNERATAEAWAQGGLDAERETKDRLHQAKLDKERKAIEEFRAWQESVRITGNRESDAPRFEVDAAPMLMVQAPMSLSQPFIEILEEETHTPNDEIAQVEPAVKSDEPDESKATKKVTFHEPVDDDSPPDLVVEVDAAPPQEHKENKVVEVEEPPIRPEQKPLVVEINKENIKPDEREEEETVEVAARRIRDSLAILRSQNRNGITSCITQGWTQEIDRKLMKIASEYKHNGEEIDFDQVSSKMAELHGSKHIAFDKESCHRRWSLLDLSAEEDNAACEGQDVFVFPSTNKALSYFSTSEGQRKSFDEMRLGDGSGCSNFASPDALPEIGDLSEDGDEAIHRSGLEELES